MATEKRIKLIKRGERHERQAALTEKSRARVPNSADEAKRDAVQVVTGWISELRRKKIVEAGRGFESLFSQSAAGAARG
jgi:hypothetical protein